MLQYRQKLEQNVSTLEYELQNAIFELKTLSNTINTDRVEVEQLRTLIESLNEDVRTQELAIRLAVSNSRENAVRCLATVLHGRVLNLTTILVVSKINI
jgi:hypothetical protein